MAKQLYGGYGGSSYGEESAFSSRFSADPYRFTSSLPSSDYSKYASSALDIGSSHYSDPNRIGAGSWSGLYGSGLVSGVKRSAEALYHQTLPGSHNTVGQSEGLFSSNSVYKHPRLETTSNLPIYPQRPGVKDCTHYMSTRTCKFGESCKFHHPDWVPEGGIPDWKEVPQAPVIESLPERPGEPDCPYYLKTQKCKFGVKCKFNHPKDKFNALTAGDGAGSGSMVQSALPERPSEPICTFYAKTGICKYGANCKFHHPKDLQIPSIEQTGSAAVDNGAAKTFTPFTPALVHNSKGLPIRPGEVDCPFYLKTGSCKYGVTCRYNHPDSSSLNQQFVSDFGQTMIPSATSLPLGLVNPAANLISTSMFDPVLTQASLGIGPTVYPQRPGQPECDFYMKTGICKFGENCKFHHPVEKAPSAAIPQPPPAVKLTLAGLPRREGATPCAFYMKTGTCKFTVTCKFDHPPPGEAVAMAAVQGSGSEVAAASTAAANATSAAAKEE